MRLGFGWGLGYVGQVVEANDRGMLLKPSRCGKLRECRVTPPMLPRPPIVKDCPLDRPNLGIAVVVDLADAGIEEAAVECRAIQAQEQVVEDPRVGETRGNRCDAFAVKRPGADAGVVGSMGGEKRGKGLLRYGYHGGDSRRCFRCNFLPAPPCY